MKKLYIIRHAKSSWKDPGLSDIDRPLNKRGRRDAPIMAKKLKENGEHISKIILSPSARTKETARHFIKEFSINENNIILEPSLYHGYPDDFEEIICSLDQEDNNIAFFGHNPGITYLANDCIGSFIDNVPTCGIIVLSTDIDQWSDFQFGTSAIINYLYPKMYVS